MLYKFLLINKTTGETKEYKTIREISKELNLDYFQVRSIYLESVKPKKFLHPITKHLVDKYAILENPEIYNN
jgi:hypothetical protein